MSWQRGRLLLWLEGGLNGGAVALVLAHFHCSQTVALLRAARQPAPPPPPSDRHADGVLERAWASREKEREEKERQTER